MRHIYLVNKFIMQFHFSFIELQSSHSYCRSLFLHKSWRSVWDESPTAVYTNISQFLLNVRNLKVNDISICKMHQDSHSMFPYALLLLNWQFINWPLKFWTEPYELFKNLAYWTEVRSVTQNSVHFKNSNLKKPLKINKNAFLSHLIAFPETFLNLHWYIWQQLKRDLVKYIHTKSTCLYINSANVNRESERRKLCNK
jgi:hypothetical protein